MKNTMSETKHTLNITNRRLCQKKETWTYSKLSTMEQRGKKEFLNNEQSISEQYNRLLIGVPKGEDKEVRKKNTGRVTVEISQICWQK